MIERRPFSGLGGANHGWLDTRHHFSYADYNDPERMNWGVLGVWNVDVIASGTGFPMHPHADMETVTYVREGAISYRDSLGNAGRIGAGNVQVMSAGTGIRNSEYNLEPGVTRIFQIWIIPDRQGEMPSWGSKPFPRANRSGRFVVLASGMENDAEALPIRADARVLGATLKAGETVEYHFGAGRYGYLVPTRGQVEINGVVLEMYDGAAIRDEDVIRVTAREETEVMLVDAAGQENQ